MKTALKGIGVGVAGFVGGSIGGAASGGISAAFICLILLIIFGSAVAWKVLVAFMVVGGAIGAVRGTYWALTTWMDNRDQKAANEARLAKLADAAVAQGHDPAEVAKALRSFVSG